MTWPLIGHAEQDGCLGRLASGREMRFEDDFDILADFAHFLQYPLRALRLRSLTIGQGDDRLRDFDVAVDDVNQEEPSDTAFTSVSGIDPPTKDLYLRH